MLILFDIDHTLLAAPGLGRASMHDAGAELFGDRFTPGEIDLAGRLDPLIVRDMLAASGLDDLPANHAAFRDAHARHMARRLDAGAPVHAMPGAHDLLRRLRAEQARRADLALGLLTGNWEPTGRLKLARAGFDDRWFDVRVWGDESPRTPPRRADLVEVAIARDAARRGHPLPPALVRIVGDTTHDVASALAHGCACLAVATGRTSADDLRLAGAHHVAHDLTDTATLAHWLLRTP